MIRRPPRSTQSRSSAASDVYKRQAVAGLQARRLRTVGGGLISRTGGLLSVLLGGRRRLVGVRRCGIGDVVLVVVPGVTLAPAAPAPSPPGAAAAGASVT